MLRRAFQILPLCLLAGLFLNFLVAAGLGLRPHRPVATHAFGFSTSSGSRCNLHWIGDFGREAISMWFINTSDPGAMSLEQWRDGFRALSSGRQLTSDELAYSEQWQRGLFPSWLNNAFDPPASAQMHTFYAAGWPTRTLYGIGLAPSRTSGAAASRGLFTRDPTPSIRALGYRILPAGTALNTLAFALPVAALAFAIPVIRKRRRIRRGRCLNCNYDLRGEFPAGCPECGWNRATPADTLSTT